MDHIGCVASRTNTAERTALSVIVNIEKPTSSPLIKKKGSGKEKEGSVRGK